MAKSKVYLFVAFSFFVSIALSEFEVPQFIPNVVDAAHVLSVEEIEKINQSIDLYQKHVDVKAAVYIVQSLEGESLESLAVKAFNQWALGDKGKDNGLLILIAMKDRKSRIEVGYGLEGDIPDLIAKRALDFYLNPGLKSANYEQGIQNCLRYLVSRLKGAEALGITKDEFPVVNSEANKAVPLDATVIFGFGFYLWILFTILVWILWPALMLTEWFRRKKLKEWLPHVRELASSSIASEVIQKKIFAFSKLQIFLPVFFTVNPGVFIWIFGNIADDPVLPDSQKKLIFVGVGVFFFVIYYLFALKLRPLKSEESLKKYIEKKRSVFLRNVERGWMTENSDGSFTYTQKYHEHQAVMRRRSSSSSGGSSSSSSHTSSSGGGRSGGGGASSSW